MIAYQSRLKYIIDEEAKIKHAEHKGREKEKIETIKSCLEKNLPIETIAYITKFSEEQVQEIIKSFNK